MTILVRETIRQPIPELTTQILTGTILDEDGLAIPGSSLLSLTLTLYALDNEKSILNDRDQQDILGANGGDVNEYGELSLELSPDDNAIADDTVEVEEHVLLFEWQYDSEKQGKQEVLIRVVNLEKVPVEPTP